MNTQPDPGLSQDSLIRVIGPLAAVFLLCCLVSCLWYCHRRRRRPSDNYYDWPRERLVAPDGNLMFYPRGRRVLGQGRWNVWGGMRSNEGLNELGEAPPPYELKRIAVAGAAANAQANANPAGGDAAQASSTEASPGAGAGAATETTGDAPAAAATATAAAHPAEHVPRQLRDMENGAMPPEYAERPAEPTVPPPAVTTDRR
ncbi:hypothetical protein VHEMI04240 [[Torrubiella] hemipterigena]|uniref:Uncharacterized protein n=1 Tax=[Torrubiella] hemipterigena TaxID=1531966 RepID=A0A0A1T0P2_9HYPO|nr:hypothetical protein VHEMI04240 [[Torrubiella] hemipterigena]